ncbi:MAG: hypothetical protein ABTD50_03530 [Polyangiaceae bacterium]|jgi:hypothetical protein
MTAPLTSARLAFAQKFPRDSRLDALVDAFASGNYAAVREQAPALVSGPDPAIASAARTLLERTTSDRNAVALVGMTSVLLVVISWYWIVHGHPPDAVVTAPPHAPAGDVR